MNTRRLLILIGQENKMKKIIIILILATLPIFAGCNSFNPEQAKKLADLADKVVLVTEELQESVVPMIENLNAQGIVSDSDTANIKKISDQIDKVQVDVVAVSEGIKTIQSEGIQGIIEGGQAINSAIPNPYQGIINVVLLALSGIAGMIAKKKTTEAQTTKTKLEVVSTAMAETVNGIQNVKRVIPDAEVVESVKNELGKAQSTATKKLVAELKV